VGRGQLDDRARGPDRSRARGQLTWSLAAALVSASLIVLSSPGVTTWRGLSLLAWVAVVPLLAVLPRQGIKRAFWLGWVAGLAINLGLCPWFPQLLARFAGAHPVLAVAATLAIAAYQGLGWAAWAALTRAWSPVLPMPLLAPAAMVIIERWMPMVFPYSLGLTQYRWLTVAQASELGGPQVVTFLMVLVGATLAAAVTARRDGKPWPWTTISVTGCVVLATVLFGQQRLATIAELRAHAPTLRVGLVQGGEVQRGWGPSFENAGSVLERYQQLSAQLEQDRQPLDLLLWPEKAYPLLLRHDGAHDYPLEGARRIRRGFQSPLVFGVTSVDVETRGIYNSAALLSPDGGLQVVYDKVRLIFFSEWLPSFMEGWSSRKRYQPGERFEPLVLSVPGRDGRAGRQVSISVFICFEAIFPGHVRKLMSRGPELLVNLSDDSWFGDTLEPEQHLSHTVFRAIESRRDLVRATSSGISAFINATGEIRRRTELNGPAGPARWLVADQVHLLHQPGLYGALGDTFCGWCLVVVVAAGASHLRRRRAAPS
jgi:apolipoprotein N-acyltransferase